MRKLLVIPLLFTLACNGDPKPEDTHETGGPEDTNGPDDTDDTNGPDDTDDTTVPADTEDTSDTGDIPVDELVCEDLALCTNYGIKNFLGEVPEAAGGDIQDGLYRLSWTVESHSDEGFAGYIGEHVSVILIENGNFRLTGVDSRGQIETVDTALSLVESNTCNFSEEDEESSYSHDFEYTATEDRLDLFSDGTIGEVEFRHQSVYLRIENPEDICALVDIEPTEPGPSAMCDALNCGCSYAIGGTLDMGTCP